MKKLLVTLLILAIAITFVNDLGRWVQASYNLNEHIREVADTAASAARANQSQGWPAAQRTAASYGIELTGYSLKNTEVTVAGRQQVQGTWVLARAVAAANRQPATAPFYVIAQTRSYLH